MDTQTARRQYLENGYDPIPLRPHSKLPAAKGWQTKPTITQWHYAREGANIGLRAGNGKAFIDCDDKTQPGTGETFMRWLDGLGLHEGDYPLVQTPNNGYHIYVNFTAPMIGSAHDLSTSFGAGEFRYGQGACVGAFPSVIAEGEYTHISGDFARLPLLDIRDTSALVDLNSQPQRKAEPKMSRLAAAMIGGFIPDKFKSRSEAEAALVLSLINSGYTDEGIKKIFSENPCAGHYHEKYESEKERNAYLYRTIEKMRAYSQHESPARRMIAELIEQANAAAWTNANRRKVFISHLEIAHRASRCDYAASVRDLALGAGVHKDTATSQTQRLIQDGLLSVKEAGSVVSASVYQLDLEKIGHSLSTPNVRKCPKFSNHDAFRNGGGKHAKGRLGRRAGEIYELIYDNPLPVTEIARQTGADAKTVKNALRKMQRFTDYRTGEIIEMVSQDGENWYSNLVDLDLIAGLIGTLGATGKQRMDYQKDRRDHARSLELGTLKKTGAA